jgi:nucleoside-diphosphate-sugar epimerase
MPPKSEDNVKILFIGGTGIISTACTKLAIARGLDVTVLNRSKRGSIEGAKTLVADISDTSAASRVLDDTAWDAVVDFIAFTPEETRAHMSLVQGKTKQYVFISSASAYQKPVRYGLIGETWPMANPHWDYSRNKIVCEELLLKAHRDSGFPATIVRPSLTYGDTNIPLAVNSWLKSYTAVDRMRQGLPVIVQGDGLTFWTVTHNTDFAKGLLGLLGKPGAIGEAFNIMSEEAPTWNEIYQMTAEAAGVPSPKLVHIASDFVMSCLPEMTGSLIGDKSNTALFDCSKLRAIVPDYAATTPFREGIARTIAWFDADPSRKVIDHEANALWDKMIAAYDRGLKSAVKEFAPAR